MDRTSDMNSWKRLLAELETADIKVDSKKIEELSKLFLHLPIQVAPRHQRDYDANCSKSALIFRDIFDRIDLSDKPLLCSLLKMLESYGHFRLAKITYHIDTIRGDEFDLDFNVYPIITKTKWYDMAPLLPEAGSIGWKAIMNHGLVEEEPKLSHACLGLLRQKLLFLSIINLLDKYKNQSDLIRRNGEKVAEKLLELIRDVAYDDYSAICIDSQLFNLLSPFTNTDQQAAIIDATIQDLFKPCLLKVEVSDKELGKTNSFIDDILMSRPDYQEIFVSKFLEHLKCNIIRRKRRHSVEAAQDNLQATLESIIGEIIHGDKLVDSLSKTLELDVSAKSLQTYYLSYWVKVLNTTINNKTLTAKSSITIFGSCAILLVALSKLISSDLTNDLCNLASASINNASGSKIEKVLKQCDLFMVELTKVLAQNTELFSSYDTPIKKFYKSYLERQLKICLFRNHQQEMEKFLNFVTFVCDSDNNLGKTASHLIQYLCLTELANLNLKNRGSKKLLEVYSRSTRACSEKLHKFIKRNLANQADIFNESVDSMEIDMNDTATSAISMDPTKKTICIEALVCLLRITIGRQDQAILDMYSELTLKLYKLLRLRLEKIVETCQTGIPTTLYPIDSHLAKLMLLYIEHKDMIKGYLDYEPIESISELLISHVTPSKSKSESSKDCKKVAYSSIKTKLEDLEKRAETFPDVYQTIINKQYVSVVEQTIGNSADIKKEKACCYKYQTEMRIINEISSIILNNCSIKTYKKLLNLVVESLEQCDTLNHAKTIYLFLILDSLIPKHNQKVDEQSETIMAFKEMMPRISCSLIMISKSVELGPSIHAFTHSGSHRSNRGIQCCTYATCIKIYTHMFSRYPVKLTDQLITDAMQMSISANLIQYAKYSTKLQKFFIQLASSIAGLLKAICMGKKDEEMLRSSMPIFLSVLSLLIRSIILASDRQKLEQNPKAQMNGHSGENGIDCEDSSEKDELMRSYEVQLRLLVNDISRTMNNLSFLKVKMVDYAPHLISAYIKDVQRSACPDYIRSQLNEGIFRIFNLVDAYQQERQEDVVESGVQRKTTAGRASGSLFEMIHARLDQASREVFRDMHDNYNKFHRYLGKC